MTSNGPAKEREKEKPFTTSLRSRTILERSTRTPSSSTSGYRTASTLGVKRDSAQAELEQQDAILATKRQLQSTLSASSLERQLALAQTRITAMQKTLSEKDAKITLLEQDRRYLSGLNESQTSSREEVEKKLSEDIEKLRAQVRVLREGKANEEKEKEEWRERAEKGERELRQRRGDCERLTREVGGLKGRVRELEKEAAQTASRAATSFSSPAPPSSSSRSSPNESQLSDGSPAPGDRTLNSQSILKSELSHQAGYLRTLESTNTKLQAEVVLLREEVKGMKERNQQTPSIWKELSVLREEKRGLEGKLKRREEEIEKLVREGESVALRTSTSSLSSSLRGSAVGSGTGMGASRLGASTSTTTAPTPTTSRTQGSSLMARSMRSRLGKSMAETPVKGRVSMSTSGSASGLGLGTSTRRGTDEMTLDELEPASRSRRGHEGRNPMAASTSAFGLSSGSSSVDAEMASVAEEGEDEIEEGDEAMMEGEEEEAYEDPPSIHITADVLALRVAHAKLLDEHGQLKAELEGLKRRCRCGSESAVGRGSSKAGGREEDDYERREKEKDEILDLKVKLRTVEDEAEGAKRELAFLTQVLAKYDADEKAKRASTTTTPPPSAPTPEALDDLTTARLDQLNQLESLYTQTKSSNSILRSEIQSLQTKLSTAHASVSSLTETNSSLQSQLSTLESSVASKEEAARSESKAALARSEAELEKHVKRIDDLEQELFELSGEVAAGRHVPPGKRVLEMKENPEREWFDSRRQVVETLKKENEGLVKRLGVLEKQVQVLTASGGDAAVAVGDEEEADPLIPRSSLDTVLLEKADLAERLEIAEKRNARLQKIYKAKTDEFKACLASILGVKLAFYDSGQLRVTSVFDLDTQLMFAPPEDDGKGKKKKVLLDEKDLEGGMREMKLVSVGEGTVGGKGKEAKEREEDLKNMINYWVKREQCMPGLMASVTLEAIEKMKREGRTMGNWGMKITAD